MTLSHAVSREDPLFDSIFGLPLHPLVVHATVVVVPAAATSVLLAAFWPRFRRWAAWRPLGLSVAASILDPLSTQSGEALEHALPRSALIRAHSEYADGLLPWLGGLVLVAFGLWWRMRSERPEAGRFRALPRWLVITLMVAAVIVTVGTTVQVVLIGHSGAEAAWSGVAI